MEKQTVQIGKGVCQRCILSPYLFDLHTEYIMRNAGLDWSTSWNQDCQENINNLKYADDTTLMAGREEEIERHLMKVRE